MSKKKILILSALIILSLDFLIYRFGAVKGDTVPAAQSAAVSESAPAGDGTYLITRVIDGDTVVVNMNGKEETIRLIGVNTPETVDPRKPVQCFGKQASDFLKNMLPQGTMVTLTADPSQSDRDKYGQLLRYIYLGDVLVNEEIIVQGYGFEYTYDVPYEFQKDFKATQNYASSGELGLWAPNTCDGKLEPAK